MNTRTDEQMNRRTDEPMNMSAKRCRYLVSNVAGLYATIVAVFSAFFIHRFVCSNVRLFIGSSVRMFVIRLFVCSSVLIFCSCASLSGRQPLTESEEKSASDALQQIIASQARCPERLDVDVTLSYKRVLFSGVVTGYLQALAPSYLRVEGVNPLGLTEFIFTTDGSEFTLLNVRGQKGYSGRIATATLEKYVPGELDFERIYSWLVGRFSSENYTISEVERGRSSLEYWAEITYDNGQKTDRLLFSIRSKRILQRTLLNEQEGSRVRFVYDYEAFEPLQMKNVSDTYEECPIPQKVIVDGNGRGKVSIVFNKNYPDPQFDRGNFSIDIPKRFTKEIIK